MSSAWWILLSFFVILRKLKHFCDTAEYAAALKTNKERKPYIGKWVTVDFSVLHILLSLLGIQAVT